MAVRARGASVCVCVYSIVPLAHTLAIISRVNSLLSGTGAVYAATRMQITLHGFYHIANTHTHTLPLSRSRVVKSDWLLGCCEQHRRVGKSTGGYVGRVKARWLEV